MFVGGHSPIEVGMEPICTFNYAFRLLLCGHGNSNAKGPMGPHSNKRLHKSAMGTKGAGVGGLCYPWSQGPF